MIWKFHNDAPIYAQLVATLTLHILSGTLKAGERLASVRDLAEEAGVNPNTMQRALTQLELDELVYSQRTAGRFVTEDVQRIQKARRALAKGKTAEFLQAMCNLGYDRKQTMDLLMEEGGEIQCQS